eukprot:COSAG02_NODE_20754_length_817_cov_0.462396_1_plen_75_part_01
MGAGPPGARAWIIAAPLPLQLRLRWPLVRAENAPSSQLFLCLSRACLGKMIVFIYILLKKTRFSQRYSVVWLATP